MKKILLVLFVLCNLSLFGYIPMHGPLNLADTLDAQGCVIERGEIMKKILSTAGLRRSLEVLMKFDGVTSVEKLRSYQGIMQKLKHVQVGKDDALVSEVFEAVGHAIMYIYYDRVYTFSPCSYALNLCLFNLKSAVVNGLLSINWLVWLAENHQESSQLISEFEQISEIAKNLNVNSIQLDRLKATTFSYRKWRMARLMPVIVAAVYWNHQLLL